MSAPAETSDSLDGFGEAASVPGFQNKRRTFLGLTAQDGIRYFFGGNATVAIIILVLICVFLLREAIGFFPEHHHELKRYRLSGLEFVEMIDQEVKHHSLAIGQLRQAFYLEINASSQDEQRAVSAYGVLKRHVARIVEPLAERVKSFEERHEDLSFTLELKQSAAKSKQEAGEAVPPALAREIVAGEKALADLDERIENAERRYRVAVLEQLREVRQSDVPDIERVPDSVWNAVLKGVGEELVEGEKPLFIAAMEDVISDRQVAAREKYAAFDDTITGLATAIKPLKSMWSELRTTVTDTKAAAVAFETAPARKEALLGFAELATDPAEKASKIAEAEAVVIVPVDFATRAKPVYASVPSHTEISQQLRRQVEAALADLPQSATLEAADESLQAGRDLLQAYGPFLDQQVERLAEWRHDKRYSWFKSIMAFFVGKDWITNSSWQDFYGLLPLFVGSLLIAIIAIVVSMPFAVGAAIYVNQLARRNEQNAIKPIIEFIGAIPSVVLGFFGILVLGTTLRDISQLEWLSWVPGFPMAERLNILNAGLLLAFMAVPTIFTLAEDAINNVPQAYTEGSLALGASKIQTVIGVIVPTAMSGVVAAILLGFGRIIGETMVVLLVAGNKIAIPDFTKGLGVVTQPAHTMTGIIAQELGEVDAGSLHWRALFIVGMVLFSVSLVINFYAQRLIKRFQHNT